MLQKLDQVLPVYIIPLHSGSLLVIIPFYDGVSTKLMPQQVFDFRPLAERRCHIFSLPGEVTMTNKSLRGDIVKIISSLYLTAYHRSLSVAGNSASDILKYEK